jgi:hypothetical protein
MLPKKLRRQEVEIISNLSANLNNSVGIVDPIPSPFCYILMGSKVSEHHL